jgi:predicted metal-binding protein
MFLDYGYRSKCCLAPIRFGWKESRKTKIKKRIFICTRCATRDVDILTTEESKGQIRNDETFAEDPNL